VALLAPLHRDDRLATGALVWAGGFDEDDDVREQVRAALADLRGRWTFQLVMGVLPSVADPATGVALLETALVAARRDDAPM